MLNICAKYYENLTCAYREITTSAMNKRTNQQTRVMTVPPDGGRIANYRLSYRGVVTALKPVRAEQVRRPEPPVALEFRM